MIMAVCKTIGNEEVKTRDTDNKKRRAFVLTLRILYQCQR